MNQYQYQANFNISKYGFSPLPRYSTSPLDPSWLNFLNKNKINSNQLGAYQKLSNSNIYKFNYEGILFDIKNGIGNENQYSEIKEVGFLCLLKLEKFLNSCNIDVGKDSRNAKFIKGIEFPISFCPPSLEIDYLENNSRVINHQGRGRAQAFAFKISFEKDSPVANVQIPVIIKINIKNNYWIFLTEQEKDIIIKDINKKLISEREEKNEIQNLITKDLVYAY